MRKQVIYRKGSQIPDRRIELIGFEPETTDISTLQCSVYDAVAFQATV
jgi:hypothetical protein